MLSVSYVRPMNSAVKLKLTLGMLIDPDWVLGVPPTGTYRSTDSLLT